MVRWFVGVTAVLLSVGCGNDRRGEDVGGDTASIGDVVEAGIDSGGADTRRSSDSAMETGVGLDAETGDVSDGGAADTGGGPDAASDSGGDSGADSGGDTGGDSGAFDVADGGETRGDVRSDASDGTDGGQSAAPWTRLLGTAGYELAEDAVVSAAGELYVVGRTQGALGGGTPSGSYDAFLAKYDAGGTRQWVELLGSVEDDRAYGVAVDGSGHVFVGGATNGDLGGMTNNGVVDGWVAKYDGTGTWQWVELLGTSGLEWVKGVAVDGAGHVYVAGRTDGSLGGSSHSGNTDAFVASYDTTGGRRWVDLLGTASYERAMDLAAGPSGNIYAVGYTTGDLAGVANNGHHDAFVARYTSGGTRKWVELIGTAEDDRARGVAVGGSGEVFVGGQTIGNLAGQTNSGSVDAYVARYDASGTRGWLELVGSPQSDVIRDVAVDGSGHVVAAGRTEGDLGGATHHGGIYDAFVTTHDTAGGHQSDVLVGTTGDEGAWGVTAGSSGTAYVVGYTDGDLGGRSNRGQDDGFVAAVGIP